MNSLMKNFLKMIWKKTLKINRFNKFKINHKLLKNKKWQIKLLYNKKAKSRKKDSMSLLISPTIMEKQSLKAIKKYNVKVKAEHKTNSMNFIYLK
jgi:hypothetical protein